MSDSKQKMSRRDLLKLAAANALGLVVVSVPVAALAADNETVIAVPQARVCNCQSPCVVGQGCFSG